MANLEQERIKALFAGNPMANFAGYREQLEKQQQAAGPTQPVAPTAYDSGRTDQAFKSFTTANPLMTEVIPNQRNYQQAIRNRLSGVTNLGTEATQNALATAQQRRMVQNNNASYSGGATPDGWIGSMGGNDARDAVLRAAASQKGMPYSWGGGNYGGATKGIGRGTENLVGFDCSGLVQYALAQVGMKMPRHNTQQLAMGIRTPINKLLPGDLVGSSGHVAIYAGNGMMWEAPTFGKNVRLVPVRDGMFGVHLKY